MSSAGSSPRFADASQSPANVLQRGFACLSCRRRKLRCDAARPSCQQCIRTNRAGECAYDDGRTLTRTQMLQARIDELEDEVRRYRPTLDDFPASLNPHSLLDVFFERRHQAHLEVHSQRFFLSLTLTTTERNSRRPHPCLLNAMYLLACHFTKPHDSARHEAFFLTKARAALTDALEHSDRLIQFIQASSLICVYLLANGRTLESYYLVCATARFAIGCGLHEIASPVWREAGAAQVPSTFGDGQATGGNGVLAAPFDSIDLGERIMTFWQLWIIDRSISMATSLPPAIGADYLAQTTTCWPPALSEFEMGTVSDLNYSTITQLYDPNASVLPPRTDSIMTLNTKATEIFYQAHELSSLVTRNAIDTNTFSARFQSLVLALSRFHPSVASSQEQGVTRNGQSSSSSGSSSTSRSNSGDGIVRPSTPPIPPRLILSHTLIYATNIVLYSILAQGSEDAYKRCVVAARKAARVIHAANVLQLDLSQLEYLFGPCWTCVAETLIRHSAHIAAADPQAAAIFENDIEVVADALERLSEAFPVLQHKVAYIRQLRGQ
ncbi:hypothetical protein BOTBODRAFT_515310 [Botryobasidium botryosum FD-172 SS1]|uniref:Zn(2)-C6 fungal-type domain-containing protein n=1 Tax=Botryobasidium botryosum (strain FD-172 SS1) TaxID=930990 RepID=A0A067MSH4_BOTB1|nr:hypothetical protein BOTBODRAFT_515310 [Botryobasidium botryosum FD-172 SS1]